VVVAKESFYSVGLDSPTTTGEIVMDYSLLIGSIIINTVAIVAVATIYTRAARKMLAAKDAEVALLKENYNEITQYATEMAVLAERPRSFSVLVDEDFHVMIAGDESDECDWTGYVDCATRNVAHFTI
jgi:hypothetical protein